MCRVRAGCHRMRKDPRMPCGLRCAAGTEHGKLIGNAQSRLSHYRVYRDDARVRLTSVTRRSCTDGTHARTPQTKTLEPPAPHDHRTIPTTAPPRRAPCWDAGWHGQCVYALEGNATAKMMVIPSTSPPLPSRPTRPSLGASFRRLRQRLPPLRTACGARHSA